jgi:hypothetical protein
VSPVRYELGFYIPEDGTLHNYHPENLKSYNSLHTSLQFSIEPMTHSRFADVHDVRIKTDISQRPRAWRLSVLHDAMLQIYFRPVFLYHFQHQGLCCSFLRPARWRTRSRDAHIMLSFITATCDKFPSMRANQVYFLLCATVYWKPSNERSC